jgi:hypothetical protein
VVRSVSAFILAVFVATVEAAAGQAAPYKIVVLAGEDSVNVIQQKTAVAPLVEVRDRNNQPVSGVMVTFAVQGGKAAAFQGGASTLTIATNAAGQAAATGFTPLTAGAVHISVEAAVQGQVVTAAIGQVNVMTAAEAAAAAGGGTGAGSGAATGGGASGGGGGLSATTIAIIGGVAAGGAVAASQLGGDHHEGGEEALSYSGPVVIEWTVTIRTTLPNGTVTSCARVERYSATLELEIAHHESPTDPLTGSNGSISGGVYDIISNGCGGSTGRQPNGWGMPDGPVTGTEASLIYEVRDSVAAIDGSGTIQRVFKFTGSLSGSTIRGTAEMTWQSALIGTASGQSPATLTRQ